MNFLSISSKIVSPKVVRQYRKKIKKCDKYKCQIPHIFLTCRVTCIFFFTKREHQLFLFHLQKLTMA